jgi:hypothetical protein
VKKNEFSWYNKAFGKKFTREPCLRKEIEINFGDLGCVKIWYFDENDRCKIYNSDNNNKFLVVIGPYYSIDEYEHLKSNDNYEMHLYKKI